MSINALLRPSSTTIKNSSGSVDTVTLRNYQHATRIFVDGDFRLSPKYNFLFYVEFDLNPLITNVSNQSAQEMGMIVKNVNLPKFSISVKEHNAYNRKNYVQTNIKYDPVTISFHDDQSDTVRNFWYDYYSYYYRDPDYADATYGAPSKYNSRTALDWGYTPRPAVGYNNSNGNQPYQYIQAIRIYSLYQKNFSEYQLINPIITSFKHGDHVNGEAGLMSHDMSIQFETVKYLTGYTTSGTVGGYIDLHYDNTPSPIAPPGGIDLVDNGQGGASHAPAVITDLANNNTAINPNLVTQKSLQSARVRPSLAYAQAFGSTIAAVSGSSAANNGGLSIPSLGSLTQGLTSGAVLGRQLVSAGIGIAGSAATSLANGVTGGLAAGLGANGGSILALGAAAIANPKGVLSTAENMIINTATSAASTFVNQKVASFVDSTVTPYFKSIGESINTKVSNAWADLTTPAVPAGVVVPPDSSTTFLPNGTSIQQDYNSQTGLTTTTTTTASGATTTSTASIDPYDNIGASSIDPFDNVSFTDVSATTDIGSLSDSAFNNSDNFG